MQPLLAAANNDVPGVNLSQTPTSAGSPYGGFQLVQCGGPDYSTYNGSPFSVSYQGKDYTIGGAGSQLSQLQAAGYRPCNFSGLTVQVQYLINVMLVLGVLAALAGFVWAGILYISGQKDKISKAHKIFPKVFWGFIIMLTAWFMVSQILSWLTGSNSYLIST